MRAVRVNETKVTSRNAFLVNLFALVSEKESQNDNDEKTLVRDYLWSLDLSLNLYASNTTYMRFSGLFQI